MKTYLYKGLIAPSAWDFWGKTQIFCKVEPSVKPSFAIVELSAFFIIERVAEQVYFTALGIYLRYWWPERPTAMINHVMPCSQLMVLVVATQAIQKAAIHHLQR